MHRKLTKLRLVVDRPVPKELDHDARMAKIRDSLEKINRLMREIRNRQK